MRGFLSFLNAGYFPFIGFLALFQLSLSIIMILAASIGNYDTLAIPVFFWIFAVFFLVLFIAFLIPMYYFFTWRPEVEWKLDLKVTREEVPLLYSLMEEVADRNGLPIADEIRLSPTTDAAVYQTKKGKQVLLIGALTVASFPAEVVATIIAHELGHIGGGDTQALKEMELTGRMMAITRAYYRVKPYGFLHPFVWLVFIYQWIFDAVYAFNSRQCEYNSDRAGKNQGGSRNTAIALFYTHVTPLIDGASFQTILESLARTQNFQVQAFTEQVRIVRGTTKRKWEKAMNRSLFHGTGFFDSHPCLSSRLKAIGVSPDAAFEWALKIRKGTPMSLDIPNWPELEKKLTIRILVPFLQAFQNKVEIGMILKTF